MTNEQEDERSMETEIIYFELEVPAHLADLTQWWLDTAAEDLLSTLPKAEEYGGDHHAGSIDLLIGGEMQAMLLGWEDATPAVKQELACWFYAQMKLARLVSDYQHRRPGKADTLKDATVYTMMMRRLQDAGIWP